MRLLLVKLTVGCPKVIEPVNRLAAAAASKAYMRQGARPAWQPPTGAGSRRNKPEKLDHNLILPPAQRQRLYRLLVADTDN